MYVTFCLESSDLNYLTKVSLAFQRLNKTASLSFQVTKDSEVYALFHFTNSQDFLEYKLLSARDIAGFGLLALGFNDYRKLFTTNKYSRGQKVVFQKSPFEYRVEIYDSNAYSDVIEILTTKTLDDLIDYRSSYTQNYFLHFILHRDYEIAEGVPGYSFLSAAALNLICDVAGKSDGAISDRGFSLVSNKYRNVWGTVDFYDPTIKSLGNFTIPSSTYYILSKFAPKSSGLYYRFTDYRNKTAFVEFTDGSKFRFGRVVYDYLKSCNSSAYVGASYSERAMNLQSFLRQFTISVDVLLAHVEKFKGLDIFLSITIPDGDDVTELSSSPILYSPENKNTENTIILSSGRFYQIVKSLSRKESKCVRVLVGILDEDIQVSLIDSSLFVLF